MMRCQLPPHLKDYIQLEISLPMGTGKHEFIHYHQQAQAVIEYLQAHHRQHRINLQAECRREQDAFGKTAGIYIVLATTSLHKH